jgi:transcriptional regulator with XRE-family HTH domain
MVNRGKRQLTTGGRAWGIERVALGLSLRDLAALSGIDRGILSMVENGRVIPDGDEYKAVMDALRKVATEKGEPA